MPPAVAIVLKGYPRLSETFIAQEILSLQRRGLELWIASLRHPTDTHSHPVHDEITAPVCYLPEYLHEEPGRVLRAWRALWRTPGFRRAGAIWLHDLKRDPTRNRARRFGQALVLAHEMPASVNRLYAHFLHTPASVARYSAHMRGIPWTCSAHAKDIWTTPAWEKREKLRDLEWLVTCTRANAEHLRGLCSDTGDKVRLAYHGLDLSRFPSPGVERPPRDGSEFADPVTLLSVGRAVEKKGYDVLLQALARLPQGLAWRLEHIGDGVELPRLRAYADQLGLGQRIAWLGSLAQGDVLAAYRRADLFVLASRVAGDGDRDGLPNVLMEAQSQALACLSTWVSAIPELIEDGETGALVEPGDPESLAENLSRLIVDPELRQRLGHNGLERVRTVFSHEANVGSLATWFVPSQGLGKAEAHLTGRPVRPAA